MKEHVLLCKIPLKKAFKTSQVESNYAESVFLILEEDGLTGYGEGVVREHLTGEKPNGVFQDLVDLLGKRKAMLSLSNGARLAYECAYYDLQGQKKGKPVYKILNPSSSIQKREYAGFIGLSDDPNAILRRAKKIEEDGASILRIKLSENIRLAKEAISTLRDHTNLKLWVDANQSWDLIAPDELAEFKDDLFMIEQPTKKGNLKKLGLWKEMGFNVMADEDIHSLEDLKKVENLVHAVNLKPLKFGGYKETREAVLYPKKKGVDTYAGGTVCTDIFATYSRHIEFAIEELDYFSTGKPRWKNLPEGITQPQRELVKRSVIKKPTEPGLGVRLDLKRLKPYIVKERVNNYQD